MPLTGARVGIRAGLRGMRAVTAVARAPVTACLAAIVEGLRHSSAAITRTVAFSRSVSAMWIRSSSRRHRAERTAL